jgi:hypothetical protein
MTNSFVAQVICGIRWPDFEDNGWGQLLVFIIVAAIYALVIAKAKKVKTVEGEEPASQPSSKSKPAIRPACKKGGKRGKRQIIKAGLPHTLRTGRRVVIQPISDSRSAASSAENSQVQPAPISNLPSVGQVIELAVRTGSKVEIKGIQIPSEVSIPRYLTEILSDYADPEKIRKVILHYEILGKPLSLREPQENVAE